jgi:hypothetical protein
MSSPASKRLLQLFERELRDYRAERSVAAAAGAAAKRPRTVSRELDGQTAEFAVQVRTSGSTPEQMLVELKALLSQAAPEVPSSERSELLSSITGRAIDAFFGNGGTKQKH